MLNALPSNATQSLAVDAKGLAALRQDAKTNSPEAVKGAAQQFEAMFINMMMKSMRAATPQEGMLDSETSKTFTTMLDQQMSQNMAKRGVGLAAMLVKQLTQKTDMQALAIGAADGAAKSETPAFEMMLNKPGALTAPPSKAAAGQSLGPLPAGGSSGSAAPHIRAFQDKLGAAAEQVSRDSGIPAKFMLGQAALETGWGKREIKNADGSTSHNLFGIKAGPGWNGKVVSAVTTEYVNGVPETRMEKFRAYDSYADSMRDYARLIGTNPRYQGVMAAKGDATQFAQGLQKAGYATDPFYASKLARIIKNNLG
jgi:flagellar protein FlgJ